MLINSHVIHQAALCLVKNMPIPAGGESKKKQNEAGWGKSEPAKPHEHIPHGRPTDQPGDNNQRLESCMGE